MAGERPGHTLDPTALVHEAYLRLISLDFDPERDGEILRSLSTPERINGKPAAEFWKDVEKK
jgi:hypothetical protein